MSTNSLIIQKTQGGFRSIYCYADGYIEYNGMILLKHYQDNDKITQLLDLGDLSSLGMEIGDKHDFDKAGRGQCTAYGRDRGEEDVDARETVTLHETAEIYKNWGIEWVYLWDGQEWLYARTVEYSEMLFSKLSDYQFKEDYGI